MANKVIRLLSFFLLALTSNANAFAIDTSLLLRIAASRPRTVTYVDPRSYPGLSMWYDASDTSTITGNPASQWNDKSGNGRHLVQATAGQRPTTGTLLRGLNTVSFHGDSGATSQWMYVTGVSNTPNTVIVVFQPTLATWADWDGLFSWRSSSSDKVSNSTVSGGVHGVNGTALVYTTGTSTRVQTDGVDKIVASFNDYNTGVAYPVSTQTAHATYYTDDISPGQTINYVVGADTFTAVGGRHANGDMCEIIVYDRALTTTELAAIQQSLYGKWLQVGGGGD